LQGQKDTDFLVAFCIVPGLSSSSVLRFMPNTQPARSQMGARVVIARFIIVARRRVAHCINYGVHNCDNFQLKIQESILHFCLSKK